MKDLDALALLVDHDAPAFPGDVVRIALPLPVARDFTAERWPDVIRELEELGPTCKPGPWLVTRRWRGVLLDLEELRPVAGFPPRGVLHVPAYAVRPLELAKGVAWRDLAELGRRRRHRGEERTTHRNPRR